MKKICQHCYLEIHPDELTHGEDGRPYHQGHVPRKELRTPVVKSVPRYVH